MGQLYEYQLWLTKLQRQPTFLNNYWCAMLSHDMEENKHAEGFKIPYFIVEKELMREDNNVHLKSRDEAYVSLALKHWLIELLKVHNENTSSLNYEEALREFLEKINLPVSRPLVPAISFHSMPSECKLWIFYLLWSYNKSPHPGKSTTKDSIGNSYFLAPGCRLYVALARSENEKGFLPIDEARLNREPWGQLYRFVHNQPCRLLCENQDGWNVVMKTFQFYNLTNLCYSLLPEITAKLTEQNLLMLKRDEQQRAFEESLAKLTSNAEGGGVQKLNQNQKRKQKKKERAALAAAAEMNAIGTDLGAVTLKATTAPNPQLPAVKCRAIQKIGKCWNFPQCPLKHVCPYTHPNIPCTEFPNCSRGWQCLFLHDFCPNDAECVEPNCAYEHVHSKPTYYRAAREPEHAVPRPVAAVPPVMRKVSDQNVKRAPEPTSRTLGNGQPSDQRVRCGFYPKWCRKGNFCEFFHPTENCKDFAAGKSCPGTKCLFLHGVCPKDGNCENLNCIFEHYESKSVVERSITAKQQKQGSLSRATSMSNLSTVSSRSRRKSVSFDLSDDESTQTKPVGILRQPAEQNRERCQFGTRCAKTRCEYTHPKEKCKAFPKCPNGGACMFLHDVCKNDGVCIKEDCDFEHNLRRNIDKRWCKKGSSCNKLDCTYLHPKACTGRCPSPGNCWMRHVPVTVAAASANPAKQAPKVAPPPAPAPTQPTPPPVPPRHVSLHANQLPHVPATAGHIPVMIPSRHSQAAPHVFAGRVYHVPPGPLPTLPSYAQRSMPPNQGGWGGGGAPRYPENVREVYQWPGSVNTGNGSGIVPGSQNAGYGGYGVGGPGPCEAPPPPYPGLSAEERDFIASKNRR